MERAEESPFKLECMEEDDYKTEYCYEEDGEGDWTEAGYREKEKSK